MACADVDMDIQAEEVFQEHDLREAPVLQYYQASEMIPDKKRPLHNLMKKHPAVLGTLQIVSGLLSVGVGIIFAVAQEMESSLFTLFRVSQMTGALFITAGLVSNLLLKYPALLTVSFAVNCGCIIVAVVGACLITADLALDYPRHAEHNQMMQLELCVLGLEGLLSVILCCWFFKEKHAKSP